MEFPVKIFLVFCFVSLHSQAIEVSTRNGMIIGSDRLRTRSGNKVIYSFTGIPYAQPPVGALRFKEPQPLRPWKTPINATGECPDCLQRRLFLLPGEKAANPTKGQEDCLRINVFTPSLDIKTKLPVMLHIHGGSYKSGSAYLEPQFLLPHVVFATVTYRLNVLGFATTGDGVIPANLGIKDQVMALKWIQENIETFGGDPNRVTVFGDSAGGSSVHLLLLSPLTKGLIHGGISSSGTAACPWAMIDRELAVTRTKKVAFLCGCPSQPSEALLECLQKAPVDNLVESDQNFRDDFSLPLTEFAPVIEESTAKNAVLTTDPAMMKSELPWITGLNTAEHLDYSGRFLRNVENKNLNLTEQFDAFLSKWLSYGFNITKEEIPAVAKKIKEFYFGAGNSINKKNINHLDLVIADGWFLKGITDAVPFHAGPTYVYYYDYEQSDKTTFKSLMGYGVGDGKGAGHLDNMLNLFPSAKRFPRRQLSPLDMQTSKNMVSLWTRFAKYGNFTPDEWEPLNKKSNSIKNYLHISVAGFIQEEDLLKERANFWKSIRNNTFT